MRIANVISKYEALITEKDAEIAGLKGTEQAKDAQIAEIQAKLPTADDETALALAEARFGVQ